MISKLSIYQGGYTVAMHLYSGLLRLAAIMGHQRAQGLIKGRAHTLTILHQHHPWPSTVWFHASSAGEMEQALPLMQAWRKRYPDDRIVLSLYSPSAYRIGHCPPEADLCLMMLADLPKVVEQWLVTLRPRLAIFIKYDYWYHHFQGLKRHQIPLYIACAKLKSDSWWFRRPIKPLWSSISSCVTEFWVQDKASLDLLAKHGVRHAAECGDTRFDRVNELAAEPFDDKILYAFCKTVSIAPSSSMAGDSLSGRMSVPSTLERLPSNTLDCLPPRPVMIGGSTWPADERLLCEGLLQQHLNCKREMPQSRWKLVLVPHEVNAEQIKLLQKRLQRLCMGHPYPFRWQLYSQINAEDSMLNDMMGDLDLLVVDRKGLLSRLYRWGDAAWVGGGFGVGIHNVLEPTVYGVPVWFGPNFRGFTEAESLVELGFAKSISSKFGWHRNLSWLREWGNLIRNNHKDQQVYLMASGITPELKSQIRDFCQRHFGATMRCLNRLEPTTSLPTQMSRNMGE